MRDRFLALQSKKFTNTVYFGSNDLHLTISAQGLFKPQNHKRTLPHHLEAISAVFLYRARPKTPFTSNYKHHSSSFQYCPLTANECSIKIASLVGVYARVQHVARVPEKDPRLAIQIIAAAWDQGGVVTVSLVVGVLVCRCLSDIREIEKQRLTRPPGCGIGLA